MTVVADNVNPYSIVCGNPGREIKKRFNDEVIEQLCKIQWWNWPVEKIKNNVSILCSDNIEQILSIAAD